MVKFLFALDLVGTRFENPFSFSKISNRFRKIQMTTNSEGEVELLVEKTGTRILELLQEEASTEVNDLVDRLNILDGHKIKSLTYKGYFDNTGTFIPYQPKTKGRFALTRIIKNPEEYYSQYFIKSVINSKKNKGLLRIYRYATGIPDKISQYLIFYGLLQILKGDTQSKVEEYIKKEIPDILILDGKNGDETIITNIRNMIAHPPKDLDIGNLNDKVSNYINELEGLVRGLLKET